MKSEAKEVLKNIRQALQKNVDEKTLGNAQKFFKETIQSYGVKIPVVTKIGKQYFHVIMDCAKTDIFGLCEDLWKSGYIEESFIACNWSYYLKNDYAEEDFSVFEHWVNKYVNNWASCDTLCNHTVGTFLEMYPQHILNLKKWAKSSNRWMRRSAAVSLIIPARKGMFLKDIFDIADILLIDSDDLVQKGYGWMLKAASETYQDDVFRFVMERKSKMPRTALRYAIEKMPQHFRAEAMKR